MSSSFYWDACRFMELNFGQQFLIHADFLLVASRESLEYQSPWNIALREGVCDAFVDMILQFTSIPPGQSRKDLFYKWPKYILHNPDRFSFWNALNQSILDVLRTKQVLESQEKVAGCQMPTSLYYVPPKFRFENNTLFDISSIRKQHRSFGYDEVRTELALIGVETLDIHILYSEFRYWVGLQGAAAIKAQPAAWHRQVAAVFCDAPRALREGLRTIPMIPLRDGSWTSANTSNLYLPSDSAGEHIPTGVSILIVDYEAAKDEMRRKFFSFLGIEKYAPRQVCDLILQLHSRRSTSLLTRAHEDIISDAAYLFKHRRLFNENGAPDIAFLVKNGVTSFVCRTSIYIITPALKSGLVSKYRNSPKNPFPVLDDRYETTICCGNEETTGSFYQWLLLSKNAAFFEHPQLFRSERRTDEWNFLRDADTTDLLIALKLYMKQKAGQLFTCDHINLALNELHVRCIDGTIRPFCGLAVPTKELQQECPHLNFADLRVSKLGDLEFLSRFGILVAPTTAARLRELEAIYEWSPDIVDKKAVVHRIYRSLNTVQSADWPTIQ